MHLVSAEYLRLFALQLARPRVQAHECAANAHAAPIEPCDVPLLEPRNAMEELLYALGCLVPPERG